MPYVPVTSTLILQLNSQSNQGLPLRFVSLTFAVRLGPTMHKPLTVTGLKPGTTYAFQVWSLDKSGFSDWSDSVTLMCT